MYINRGYAKIRKNDNTVLSFINIAYGEELPEDDDSFFYIMVSESNLRNMDEFDPDPTGRTAEYVESFHPSVAIDHIYYPKSKVFSLVPSTDPLAEFYVYDKISKQWRMPQISDDKVTHVWSNLEQDYIRVE